MFNAQTVDSSRWHRGKPLPSQCKNKEIEAINTLSKIRLFLKADIRIHLSEDDRSKIDPNDRQIFIKMKKFHNQEVSGFWLFLCNDRLFTLEDGDLKC